MKALSKVRSEVALMTSMSDIGIVTAYTLLAELPELSCVSNKHRAALLGVAPFIKQSGQEKGRASVNAAKQAIRNALYMAALIATQ